MKSEQATVAVSEPVIVSTSHELTAALKRDNVREIKIRGSLTIVPSVRLAPGQALRGENDQAEIRFRPGTDGLQLSSDNKVNSVRLLADTDKRAIFNDTSVDSLGHISLSDITTTGQVQILARDKVRSL